MQTGYEKVVILDEYFALSRKWYKTGYSYLLWKAKRKSYAIYRMVQFPMTSSNSEIFNDMMHRTVSLYDEKIWSVRPSVSLFTVTPTTNSEDQFMQTFDSYLIKTPVKMVVVRCFLILWSKLTKNNCLSAGFRPEPLEELTALPKTPTWIGARVSVFTCYIAPLLQYLTRKALRYGSPANYTVCAFTS